MTGMPTPYEEIKERVKCYAYIYANAVDIGRPVFGPDPVRVHMTAIGKYRLEVLSDGT